MSLITGPEIARRIGTGELVIVPYDPGRLNPNSYNLSLGPDLLVYDKMLPLHRYWDERNAFRQSDDGFVVMYTSPNPPFPIPLDTAVDEPATALTIPASGMVLWPGVLYLGSTLEYTETAGLAPKLDGRSSVGRVGQTIHVTAGFGDDGFKGDWTLELTVVYPLVVYPGTPVCQIAYSTLEGVRQPYAGQYQDQRGPKTSGLWRSVRKLFGKP